MPEETPSHLESHIIPQPGSIVVSMWLDSYDDIFSDFDPRPYSRRVISDDFIGQLRKITREQQIAHVLELLVPASKRNRADEEIIARQLHVIFNQNYEQLLGERKQLSLRGIGFTAVGMLFMVIASYLSFNETRVYYIHLLRVLCEPAGWFLLWTGLDLLLSLTSKTKKEIHFLHKMASAQVSFGQF